MPLAEPRRHRLRRLGRLSPTTPTRRRGRRASSNRATSSRSRASSTASSRWPAVFDPQLRQAAERRRTSRRASPRCDLAEQVIGRHRALQEGERLRPPGHGLVRLDRGLPRAGRRPRHRSSSLREGPATRATPTSRPSMIYAYAALQGGRPLRQRRAEPDRRHPGACWSWRDEDRHPDRRQGLQDRPDADEDHPRPGLQGAPARASSGWYSTNILGNRDGEVLDDPESFKTKESLEARRARAHPAARRSTPTSTARSTTRCASTTTRRAATTRKAGTTSTSSGGWATRCRSRWTSSAATRSSRPRSCSTWRCSSDLAQRAGHERASRSGSRSTSRARMTAPGALPRARPLHPADEAQEHAAPPARRGAHHPPRAGVLRLAVAVGAGVPHAPRTKRSWPHPGFSSLQSRERCALECEGTVLASMALDDELTAS